MTSARFPPPIPPLDVRDLLRRYGLHARKRLGQNFLQDTYALERIVEAASILPSDTVLEIGPGLGSLTRYLAAVAKIVIAVELDERLFPALQAVVAPYDNLRLVHGDILESDPAELVGEPDYLVVANIPYYITSALIRHLLEKDSRPRRLLLTVQKEVANRICAGPGAMSLLSLSVQVYGDPSVAAHIPARAFYPPPNVDSAILRIDVFPKPAIPQAQLESFFQLIRAGFSQKRKTLRNSLSAGMRRGSGEIEAILGKAGIDPKRRAETLDLQEWGRLSRLFHEAG